MALVVKDRVKETTTTTGTGTITLGGAVQGFQTFTSVLSNADTTYYAIVDFTNHEFEVGIGTFTSSGTTLARTTILESSNSGSAVNLGSGTKEVFITYPAEKSVYLDASNQLVINGSAVTSTVSELNILDGVTSTASELNILDGVTSTTAELNILDGVTSTTAELNILDGVTSTAAELNILDGKSFVDEDDMSSNSATAIASQQSIKAYVDSQVTAQDLDLTTDSGTIAIDLDSETLTIGGTSNEIETSATGNAVTIGLPSATQITTSLGVGGGSTNGVQISQGAISIKNGGTQSYVDFYCESSNAHYARLQAPAHSDFSGNITLTLPATAGTVALTSSNITGNAATATALATARTIHGVSFDGTSNIDLSEVIQDTVGAMFSSNTETNITATYQDSDGTIDLVIGTLNQDTTGNAATATALETARTIHGVSFDGTGNIDLTEVVQDTVGAMFSSNTESGITVTYQDSDGTIDLTVGTLNQDTTGNAATATALETARTIHGVSFDGTGNIDLTEVIEDTVGAMFSSNTETGITATYQDSDGTIDLAVGNTVVVSDGSNSSNIASGGTITFSGTSNEVDVAESSGTITIGLPSNVTISGELDVTTLDVSGNADIDGTLEADAITINGVTLAETISDTVGAMVTSNTETGITVTYDDSDNTLDFVIGTLNQDTTGNSATATALETARTIGGVSFDGTANINLPGVNTAGNQNTSGNAATATLSSTVIVTDSTANTNFPVVFHDESNALLDDTGALRYNPSTGELLVPKLTVAGTTTVVDTVTMNAANAIVFEGATADAHETTLSIVDPTSDHTQYLINQGGYIPVLAAATTTAITSTPEELNVLDGITSTTTELNIVDGNTSATSITVADADRVVLNDNGTMVQVAVTDLAAYFDDEITAMPNLVSTGTLNSGSITSGFGNINNGSSTITTTGLISGGSLDIDDVLINGSNIGHTDDTDLITLANGIVTVAGEVSVTTLDIGGTNVTSTAAELNILDGVTSTTSELNILDGVTSTTAELNILDGVTSTTSELNLLDGVTSTTSELNVIDGDTSASSTTLVDADRVVTNDNGTMKQVALTDIKTYLTSAGYASQADATALAIALG